MRMYIATLLAPGGAAGDLRRVTRDNPARVPGLSEATV